MSEISLAASHYSIVLNCKPRRAIISHFRKNNLAAKKSRDARRVRENQLRLRVLCLENANRVLREQMDRKEVELAQLRY